MERRTPAGVLRMQLASAASPMPVARPRTAFQVREQPPGSRVVRIEGSEGLLKAFEGDLVLPTGESQLCGRGLRGGMEAGQLYLQYKLTKYGGRQARSCIALLLYHPSSEPDP